MSLSLSKPFFTKVARELGQNQITKAGLTTAYTAILLITLGFSEHRNTLSQLIVNNLKILWTSVDFITFGRLLNNYE